MSASLGPSIIRDNNLSLILDAADRTSYRGSGTSWNNLTNTSIVGTLVNSPTFSNSNGGSFTFNGTNQYVNVTNTASGFDFSNTSFTVSVWVKTTSTSAAVIFAKGGTTGGWGLRYNTDGTVTAFTKNGSSSDATTRSTTSSIKDGKWHNIKLLFTTNTSVIASNNIQIYLDSILNQGTLTASAVYGAESASTLKLANLSLNNYFNGSISKISIYSKLLTNKEMFQNYTFQKTRFDS